LSIIFPGTAAGGESGAEEQNAVEQNAADADANNSNAADRSSKPGSASVKSQHADDFDYAAGKSPKSQYWRIHVFSDCANCSFAFCTMCLM